MRSRFDIRPSSASKRRLLSVSSRLTRPSGSETGIKPSWVTCAPKTSNESFWIGRRDGKVKRSALSDRPRAQSQDGKYFYAGRTRLPPGLAWMLTVQAHHAPEAVSEGYLWCW